MFSWGDNSVVERCHAELEERYTSCFSTEDAMEWHLQHLGSYQRGLLEIAPENVQPISKGYTVLWQCIIGEPNIRVCKRVIYALQLEQTLREALLEKNGAMVFSK